ncbi:MAG: hemolysin family protein [Bacteroidales bacterium]|nr:hemolysin family protein [Bacteroidales bacterium]
MEIFVILGLIFLNGFLALSEMALVSSRKSRLESDSKHGDNKAKKALDLTGSPDKFLSTIQIGITTIGILTGIFSGESIADWLYKLIVKIPALEASSYTISVVVVVVLVTYFSLIFGELIPKRIAMSNPERFAKMVAKPMNFLSKLGSPFVYLLSISTKGFMKLFGISATTTSKVTEEEIKAILQEGTEEGEIQEVEHDIVERAFNLGDRDVNTLMTHRNELVWLDIEDSLDEIKKTINAEVHSVYPVASEQLDEMVGVVFLKEFFADFNDPDFNLRNYIRPAQFVPETMNGYNVLELFRKSQRFYAIIIDEYGSIQGMVTMNDLMEALVGNILEPDEHEEQIIQREDGSWLVDGQYSFYDFLAYFDMEDLYQEHDYNTLSGLILDILERIPNTAEKLRWKDFEMEIVDMDAARIDKVLVKRIEETE